MPQGTDRLHKSLASSLTIHSLALVLGASAGTLMGCSKSDESSAGDELRSEVKVEALSRHWVRVQLPEGAHAQAMTSASDFAVHGPDGELDVLAVALHDEQTLLIGTESQRGVDYELEYRGGHPAAGMDAPAPFKGSEIGDEYLESATPLDNTHIVLRFSDDLEDEALDLANYAIDSPNLEILAAEFSDDDAAVVLTTSPQEDLVYTVRVDPFGINNDGPGNSSHNLPLDPTRVTAEFSGIAVRDETPPRLVGATAVDNQTVLLTFSEALADDADDVLTNFVIDNNLTILSATLVGENTQIRLLTMPQETEVNYTVTVTDLKDLARNTIEPADASASFTLSPITDGELLPRVAGAISTDNTHVIVRYTRPMSDEAADPANYAIVQENINAEVGYLQVLAAEFLDGGNDRGGVRLTTASQSEVSYQVAVVNVTDTAGNHFPSPQVNLNAVVDFSKASFPGTPANADVLVDTDGDGLSDDVEQRGYSIPVEKTTGEVEIREVTSDPTRADTDGDGVNDRDEMHFGSDPRRADTDGDTLSDNQELNEIYSSPADQDSDNDGLQDGLEFEFFKTSPLLADTDGDQLEDFDEVVAGNRDPRIADLPRPRIAIGNVSLELDTRFSFTDEEGVERSVEESSGSTLTQSQDESYSTSDENSTVSTLEVSTELTAEVEFPKGGGFSTTLGTSSGLERGHTSTFGTESSIGSEESYEESLTTSETVDVSKSVTREVVDASFKVDLTIENTSNIPFTISNIELTAQTQDPRDRRRLIPVASLVPANPDFDQVNIGALGDLGRGPFVFSAPEGGVFPTQVENLLKNPRGLVVKLANFDITDEQGRNFVYTSQDILDRTAGINIDFGDGRVESYRVATNSIHDGDGRPTGITMAYALVDILDLDYATTTRLVDTDGDTIPDTPENVLTRVREVETATVDDPGTPNLDETNRFWAVYSSQEVNSSVAFDDIVLRAGDQFNFTFVQDQDSDGVWAREEYLHGSSDLLVDTDGDGLTDAEEIQDGWTVQLKGNRTADPVYPNPVQVDSDRDLLDDHAERSCAIDPRQRDTDLDGLTDYEELNGVVIVDGLEFPMEVLDPDTGEVLATVPQYTGIAPSAGLVPHDPQTYTAACNSALGISGYATDPLNPDTDGDGILDGAELELGINPNDSADGPLFLDDDGDGVPNLIERQGWVVTINDSSTRVYSSLNNGDSDDDGLSDLLEFYIGSDPQSSDTDGDGITDLNEYKGGGDACVTETAGNVCVNFSSLPSGFQSFLIDCEAAEQCYYDESSLLAFSSQTGTNPSEADSDFDGLDDPVELAAHSITVNGASVALAAPSSDPLLANTDGDGWNDATERSNGTNPRNTDTDGDGTEDHVEGGRSRNPLQEDKRITISYTRLVIVGDCERAFFGVGDGEFRWSLNYQRPVDIANGNGPFTTGDWLQSSDYGVDGSETVNLTGGPISFVADFGETFRLEGFLQELDDFGADGTLDWDETYTVNASFVTQSPQFATTNPDGDCDNADWTVETSIVVD